MTAQANFVHLDFPSKPENIGFARAAAALFATQLPFTLDEIEEIKVAVSEAVSNAVVHAYAGGEGAIRMTLAIEGNSLVVTVEDRGKGIEDVEWAKQPTHTTSPEEHMGLGFVFIREYMNDVEIASKVGEGTVVRMVKAASAASPAPPGRAQ